MMSHDQQNNINTMTSHDQHVYQQQNNRDLSL